MSNSYDMHLHNVVIYSIWVVLQYNILISYCVNFIWRSEWIMYIMAGTFDMNLTRNPLSSKHTTHSPTHTHKHTHACKPLSLSLSLFSRHFASLFFSIFLFIISLCISPLSFGLPFTLCTVFNSPCTFISLPTCLHFQNSLSLSSCQCPFPFPPFIRGITHDSKVIPCNNIVLIDVLYSL